MSRAVTGLMPWLVGPSSERSFALVDIFGASFVEAILAAKDFIQIVSKLGGALEINNLMLESEKEIESLPSFANFRWSVMTSQFKGIALLVGFFPLVEQTSNFMSLNSFLASSRST